MRRSFLQGDVLLVYNGDMRPNTLSELRKDLRMSRMSEREARRRLTLLLGCMQTLLDSTNDAERLRAVRKIDKLLYHNMGDLALWSAIASPSDRVLKWREIDNRFYEKSRK